MQAVIIAAGNSTRFWPLSSNGISKTEMKLLGKSLVYWAIRGVAENGIKDIIVVVSSNSSIPETLKQENDLGVQLQYAAQEEALGTGNALLQAKPFITGPFVLLWGNKIGSKELVAKMIAKQKEGADAVFVGTKVEDPSEYGVFELEGEKVMGIVEKPQQGQAPSNVAVSGARLLTPDFFTYYENLADYHEVDLIDATNEYLKKKSAFVLLAEQQGLTLKYPWDLFGIMDFLFAAPYYFKPQIAKSSHIARNVVIKGPVYVGENTVVKEGTVLEGPVYIGDNCVIGYNNIIRGAVNIAHTVKTGAFMEIKHSIVQEGTHMHSGFLGDSIVGKGCRFGAGFVSGNRRLDRQEIQTTVKDQSVNTNSTFFGTVVGNNSMFGIHSGTMPGIMIGSNCKVGPGTHVFDHLDDNTTFYAKYEEVKK